MNGKFLDYPNLLVRFLCVALPIASIPASLYAMMKLVELSVFSKPVGVLVTIGIFVLFTSIGALINHLANAGKFYADEEGVTFKYLTCAYRFRYDEITSVRVSTAYIERRYYSIPYTELIISKNGDSASFCDRYGNYFDWFSVRHDHSHSATSNAENWTQFGHLCKYIKEHMEKSGR